MDAKGRQKWIDRIRACSGSNAATLVSMHTCEQVFGWGSFVVKYVSSFPIPKANQTNASPVAHSPNEAHSQAPAHRTSKYADGNGVCGVEDMPFVTSPIRSYHHQQTVKELREVMRCVEVNQRKFAETIDVCCNMIVPSLRFFLQAMPENIPLHSLSKVTSHWH